MPRWTGYSAAQRAESGSEKATSHLPSAKIDGMKFMHASDLHIDSPLRGLAGYAGAPVERVRHATREALVRLVDLCLDQQAAFLIVAGDLFDHDWKDFNTALFVVKQFQRLDREGVPVYVIRGNHDSRAEMSLQVPWPTSGRFKLFSHKQAETVILPELGVAIHGMSFAERHVRESLLPKYPAPLSGMLNIGILHTSATGASGLEDHPSYAPCTIKELVDKGYQYWALGHVHQRQVLQAGACRIVYPGNTQGRHIRETGPKGCAVVTVEDGAIESIEFVSTDVLRWKEVEIELSAHHLLDDLYELVASQVQAELVAADERLLGVRLKIQGGCTAHRQLNSDAARREADAALRARVGEISDDVWLEKIKWQTRPPMDRDVLREGQDFIGELLRDVDQLAVDDAQFTAFLACLQPLIDKTLSDFQAGRDDDDKSEQLIDFESAVQRHDWLQAAEGLLLNQLTKDDSLNKPDNR